MENPLQLRISIAIYNRDTSQNMNVTEEFDLRGIEGFSEICKIIGLFHDLAAKVKAEKGPIR